MADYAHLLVDTSAEGVRTLTLDRPEKLNAVNGALASSLSSAVADAAAEDSVRVVIITGSGRAFCAGLDLSEPPTLPSSTRVERLDPFAWVGTWVRSVVHCEKPVIAAVNGAAIGAGCEWRSEGRRARWSDWSVRLPPSRNATADHRSLGGGGQADQSC